MRPLRKEAAGQRGGVIRPNGTKLNEVEIEIQFRPPYSQERASIRRPPHAIPHRMNLDDVMIEGLQIYGRGINVAARLAQHTSWTQRRPKHDRASGRLNERADKSQSKA